PLSRETTPKQILNVVGEESLLASTIRRLSPLITPERAYIVTNKTQAEIIRLHLSYGKKALTPGYIVEPFGRNTAPAIGLAAIELYKKDPDAVMAVLPADHLIRDAASFRDALKAAVIAAEEGRLVTFGIIPTRPETGYGYIKAKGKAVENTGGCKIFPVESFVEKPDIKRARRFLKSKGYFWNSGMFVWKASRILEEIKNHLPEIYEGLIAVRDGADISKAYEKMESISIDHGVLEKVKEAVVIPANFRWSDVGSWSSFGEILDGDKDGNIIKGRVVDIGSRDSIILGCDRVVAAIGLRDMILVDTPDATLVCPKDRAQDVKAVVDILKKKGYTEHQFHKKVERPWGSYTLLEQGQGYKIKKICVLPKRRLSLQLHSHRSEHWVVITGTARVQREEETVLLAVNQSTYIPRGVKHRLENPGNALLEIIEVQSGGYVEEDDIVRFDDDFKRG
ncbi:MAG: mannose-1-phosphate guanylyltransferase/mannose-6-phosphate isomerase, partial [Deltaproteobacteria bacterium]|nr:mannose-1-phosphate guanylyltransferase/mannose-6-phosphate isomerase [Deltaproteobacteria bacterium]